MGLRIKKSGKFHHDSALVLNFRFITRHKPKTSSHGILMKTYDVGLWRSWERASMAWKRSRVRISPGPPSFKKSLFPECQVMVHRE